LPIEDLLELHYGGAFNFATIDHFIFKIHESSESISVILFGVEEFYNFFVRVTTNSWPFNLRKNIFPSLSKNFLTTWHWLILSPLQDQVGKEQRKLPLTSSFGTGIFSSVIFSLEF
jgi:hypothetical protein